MSKKVRDKATEIAVRHHFSGVTKENWRDVYELLLDEEDDEIPNTCSLSGVYVWAPFDDWTIGQLYDSVSNLLVNIVEEFS